MTRLARYWRSMDCWRRLQRRNRCFRREKTALPLPLDCVGVSLSSPATGTWLSALSVVLGALVAMPAGADGGVVWPFAGLASTEATVAEEALGELEAGGNLVLYELWTSEGDVVEWFRSVLREGSAAGRAYASVMLVSLFNPYSSMIPDIMELAADESSGSRMFAQGSGVPWNVEDFRGLGMLPVEVDDAEGAAMLRIWARRLRQFRHALPGILAEEQERREVGVIPSEDEVLEHLLWCMAFLEVSRGTDLARKAAWRAYLESPEGRVTHAEALVRTPFEAYWRREAWRFGRLEAIGDMLREEDVPILGRRLDPEVRAVASSVLRSGPIGSEAARMAAYLLGEERPVAEGTARLLFDRYCGPEGQHCLERLGRLYAGPDTPALRSVSADVDAYLIRVLSAAAEERSNECRRRSRTQEAGVKDRVLRESAAAVADSTERIGRLLDVVERVDEPAPEVLDAVFGYWAEERDGQAREILEKHGLLAAAPEVEPVLPARGDCLAAP